MYFNELKDKIFSLNTSVDFNRIALDVFRFQYLSNPVYRRYCEGVNKTPDKVGEWHEIPFLPVSFFKTHAIKTGEFESEVIFKSSGTTGQAKSKHYVRSLELYEKSFLNTFNNFYGSPGDYCILALLPSYLERKDASLIYMVNSFMEKSEHPQTAFYLDEYDKLRKVLTQLKKNNTPTLLLGVSFALLDMAEKYPIELDENFIIMETGGMKGKRKELIREELHDALKKGFGVKNIHSEYGMTELLSQAYAKENGFFKCPPQMKILIREVTDPFNMLRHGESGAINIIDLANLHSCAFIETMDLGKTYPDSSFKVLGRMDNSDIRGCNLMVD